MATDPHADDPATAPESAPPPTAVEQHMLALIEAQARRLGAQAEELERQRNELKDTELQRLLAAVRKEEVQRKYAQLRLEAWLGLAKVAIVVVAIAFVLWFMLPDLLDLLDALPRSEALPAGAAVQAPAVSTSPGAAPSV